MKRQVLAAIVVCLLAPACWAQTYKLTPTYTPGARWEATWESLSRINTMDTPMGKVRVSGYMQDKGGAEFLVAQVADGGFKTLEITYRECQLASQAVGAQRPTSPKHPLSRRKITIERRIDPDTKEERFEITGEGEAIAPDVEDALKAAWCATLIPNKPLAIGERWKSERVDRFFGSKTKGGMTLTLARIEAGPGGRRQAVIDVTGESLAEIGATAGQAGSMDLAISCTFQGKIKVNTTNGMIESIDLSGPMRLDHGGNVGAGVTQYADWTYKYQTTMLEAAPAVAVAVQPPAGAGNQPNPLEDPLDFSGVYKDDRLTVEFKPAGTGYGGSVTYKGKIYPAKAAARGQALEGTYEAGADAFPFTATLSADGKTMKFTSGRAEYTLKKQEAKKPPAEPNPLEQP